MVSFRLLVSHLDIWGYPLNAKTWAEAYAEAEKMKCPKYAIERAWHSKKWGYLQIRKPL